MGFELAINPRHYDKDNGQSGMAPFPPVLVASAIALSATNGRSVRIVPSRDINAVSLGIAVTTAAGSNDAIDLGIFDATMANKLRSTGAVTGQLNSTGFKWIALTSAYTMLAGQAYYLAYSPGTVGSTAAQVGCVNVANNAIPSLFGSTAPSIEAAFHSVAGHPLPSSLTPTASTVVPFIAVRES